MKKIKKIENEELKKFKEEIEELKIGWQRTHADFENYRKRTEQDRQELIKFANLDILEKLFPIMDNFKRAATHTPKELENSDWAKGIKQIEKQLDEILLNEGLRKIEPRPGEEFNPQFQEAISSEENKDFKSNQVIELVEVGYRIGDKIVRPAKVRVRK